MTIQGRPLETITRDISAPGDPAALASLHAGEAIRPPQTAVDGMEYRLSTPEGASNRCSSALRPIRSCWSTSRTIAAKRPSD